MMIGDGRETIVLSFREQIWEFSEFLKKPLTFWNYFREYWWTVAFFRDTGGPPRACPAVYLLLRMNRCRRKETRISPLHNRQKQCECTRSTAHSIDAVTLLTSTILVCSVPTYCDVFRRKIAGFCYHSPRFFTSKSVSLVFDVLTLNPGNLVDMRFFLPVGESGGREWYNVNGNFWVHCHVFAVNYETFELNSFFVWANHTKRFNFVRDENDVGVVLHLLL